jgi:putative transposase
MTTAARARYSGYRFPAEIISHAVWLYFRFPLGLRMVEELLAARGIIVSHETVRQWARKFGQQFANRIRRRLPRVGDKRHLDEVVLKIAGADAAAPRHDHRQACPTAAKREVMPGIEHRQHKALNNRAENSHQRAAESGK